MATIIAFRLDDSENDTKNATFPLYLPDGLTLAQYQAVADAFIPLIEAVTDAGIVGIDMTVALSTAAVTQGSPVAGSYNERGGLISFDTTGTRRESVRIPAIKTTIMSGDSFDLAQTDIDALVTALTDGVSDGVGTTSPLTPYGYEWVEAKKAVKSGRKF